MNSSCIVTYQERETNLISVMFQMHCHRLLPCAIKFTLTFSLSDILKLEFVCVGAGLTSFV